MKLFIYKVIAVIVCLAGLELALQAVHLLMTFQLQSKERQFIQKESFRILTLGESTTDSRYLTTEGFAWPELLEKELKDEGFDVQVINLGTAATTTNDILAELTENLKRTRPNLVISMIGINDQDRWSVHLSQSPLKKLRIYKILSWLRYSLPTLLSTEAPELIDLFPPEEFLDSKLRSLLQARKDEINDEVSNLDTADQARLYTHWAMSEPDPTIALEFYEKAFKDGHIVRPALGEYTYLLCKKNHDQICRQAFELALQKGVQLNPFERMNAECCSKLMEDSNDQGEAWAKILNQNDSGFIYYQQNESYKKNYQRIHQIIQSESISHIAMQYPMRELRALQELWAADGSDSKPIFVSNRENFLEVLKTKSYEEIFLDRFADDFGHTTIEGHRLIALNLKEKILSEFRAIMPQTSVEPNTQSESKDH